MQLTLLLALPLVLAAAVSTALISRRNTDAGNGRDDGAAPRTAVQQTGISVEFQGAAKQNSTLIDAEWYQDRGDVRAHVHAAVPGRKVFYEAFAAKPADVRLAIDDDLSRATLTATVRVERCVDQNGEEDAHDCPIGRVFSVEGSWFDTANMESWRVAGEQETNLVRGRLGKATVSLNGESLGTSPYAEIVTNHITPPGGDQAG